MAALLSIKRRIKTAKNVSKTTKAMQLISASKLKRAQESAVNSKPYAEKLEFLSKNLYSKIDNEDKPEYMKITEKTNSKLYIVISPDKGLSGGMVTNLIKEVVNSEEKNKCFYIVVGKKAQSYLSAIGKDIIAAFPFGNSIPSLETVYTITTIVDDYFLNKKVSEVFLITTKFSSVFTQRPTRTKLLPIFLDEKEMNEESTTFEPELEELLPDLLRHYIEMVTYQSLLESYASEQAARMIAMKNATDNANDMIEDLNLLYNKNRQEKITNELLDIGGASYAQS